MPSHRARLLLALATVALAFPGLAAAATVTEGDVRIEYAGTGSRTYANLDSAVIDWMDSNDIHYAELAVRKGGVLLVSHAYSRGSATKYKTITTADSLRLASISKMTVTAAFSQLLEQNKLTGGERVYPYLGIKTPLLAGQKPDAHADSIISLELAEHTAGLPGEGDGDPLFEMRDIEVKLGHEPLTLNQFARYLYGLQLNSLPGVTANYSNVGYLLLGMVIQKAAGKPYLEYINQSLMAPLGMSAWTVAPTSEAKITSGQVPPDSPYTGRSVFNLTASAPQKPFNFEGGDVIWENTVAPSDLMTTAENVTKFIHRWNVYGLGARAIDYARDGCTPGVSTWAESLNTDIDFSVLFNKQPCLDFNSSVINTLRNGLGGL